MLTLPIKRKWLEMIRSGQKKEEYRSLSPYYAARFKRFLGREHIPATQAQVEKELRARGSVPFKDIILRAGYSAFAPATMISGYITISTGRPVFQGTRGSFYCNKRGRGAGGPDPPGHQTEAVCEHLRRGLQVHLPRLPARVQKGRAPRLLPGLRQAP